MKTLTEGTFRRAPKVVNNKHPIKPPPSQRPNFKPYPKTGDVVRVHNYCKSINGKIGFVKSRDGEYITVQVGDVLYGLYPCEVTVIGKQQGE